MENNTCYVDLTIEDCQRIIHDAVVEKSLTGEPIDCYEVPGGNGRRCVIAVYQKLYYRAAGYLTLTVTMDDLAGCTRVHYIGGGGCKSDLGAAKAFAAVAEEALRPHIIEPHEP